MLRKIQIFLTGQLFPERHKNKIVLRVTVAPDFHHKPKVFFTASDGDKGDKRTSWAPAQLFWTLAANNSLFSYTRGAGIKETEFALKAYFENTVIK